MSGEFRYLARWALDACDRAYNSPNVTNGNAQASVYYTASIGLCFVAYAGTNDVHDAAQDVRFCGRVEVGDRIRIHRGFWKHANMISQAVRNKLHDLKVPADCKLIVTGHSLGAAVAALELFRHPMEWRRPSVAYLFGCPRVGNCAFSEAFAGSVPCRVHRIVSRGDPVANLPWHWLGRWCHVGEEHLVGSGWDADADHPLEAYRKALA